MTDLERLLEPALGYLHLGMLTEANDEIAALPPALQESKEALGIRVLIHEGTGAWKRMWEISGFLAHEWPEESQHWIWFAYATRRCRSVVQAKAVLVKAVGLHPSDAMIHFNLARYHAQSGDLDSARDHLAHADELEPGARLLALSEADFALLWPEIGDSESTDTDP